MHKTRRFSRFIGFCGTSVFAFRRFLQDIGLRLVGFCVISVCLRPVPVLTIVLCRGRLVILLYILLFVIYLVICRNICR